MLTIENLEKFTKQNQTSMDNIMREYCQHVFLSAMYKQHGSERLLFKGGTALRIVFGSPRYSEDLDFSGISIKQNEIEEIFTDTLSYIENTGMRVELEDGKPTTGGYLGSAYFFAYGHRTALKIQVSLRRGKDLQGVFALIENDYVPIYGLVHLTKDAIVQGKMQALMNRYKPRDFYDYFFLLSGNYPVAKERENLIQALKLLKQSKINFRNELRRFLPNSHSMHLRNFKKMLEQKIVSYLG